MLKQRLLVYQTLSSKDGNKNANWIKKNYQYKCKLILQGVRNYDYPIKNRQVEIWWHCVKARKINENRSNVVQGQHIHSYLSFCSFKKYKCFCNNEIYVFFGEKRKKKRQFLQNCKLKIIRLMGKRGLRQTV